MKTSTWLRHGWITAREWERRNRHLLLIMMLVWLMVGTWGDLHYLRHHAFGQNKSEMVAAAHPVRPNIDNEEDYWKGTVDASLKTLNDKMDKLDMKYDKLTCSVSDIQISAAKHGGVIGGIVSLCVGIVALLGKMAFSGLRRKGPEPL